jgi:transposase
MSRYIKGQSRTQTTLFPEAIDDFVTEDNPIRVIDVFVDQLDLLELGFDAVNAKLTGRLGYHPSTMLKLYICGYLSRIQSSRRLEKESHRNVELVWLLERLRPDLKPSPTLGKIMARGLKMSAASLLSYVGNSICLTIQPSPLMAVSSRQ